MKKLFFIIFNISSITSLSISCQNNLDQAANSILNNVKKQKEELAKLHAENNYQQPNVTLDQLQAILIAQATMQNSELVHNINNRKNAHQKLEAIIIWFEQKQTSDDWINYFAIHNQIMHAIQMELETLKEFPQFYKEIGERIIKALDQAIEILYENNGKSEKMISLIYIKEDYIKLFQKYGLIKL